MSLPITLLFFTTTKGHFDRRDIYAKTLKDWNDNSYLNLFEYKYAHIKDGGEQNVDEMVAKFNNYWFDKVLVTEGKFQHFSPSHSLGQLQDIGKLAAEINKDETPYLLILEDDWLVRTKNKDFDLSHFLERAMFFLDENPNISQVRIPRHLNDFEHYKTLRPEADSFYSQNDIYSFNPHIARTEDLQIISNSVAANAEIITEYINKGMINSELTFTQFARQLRGDYGFWSFSSDLIQAFHIGTPENEEDKIIEK